MFSEMEWRALIAFLMLFLSAAIPILFCFLFTRRKQGPIPVLIHVTKKHINAANMHSCNACAVALALREATGKDWEVAITVAWRADVRTSYALPRDVGKKIMHLIQGKPVSPFTFEWNH